MLETKHLVIFRTIAEVGSFTRAAMRLGMSQPAISQQIRALEEQAGVPLLVRRGRSARPTPAGEMLLHYARQVLTKLGEVERALGEERGGQAGLLRIGAGGAVCQHLLPGVLGEFRRRFPKVDLEILSGHTDRTLERLKAAEVDVGVVTLPIRAPRIRVTEIGRDELLVVLPAGHALAEKSRLRPPDLIGQPFIIYERQTRATDLILGALLADGVFPRVVMEMDHLEATKAMVAAGLGMAVLPEWTVRAELANETLVARPLGKAGLWRSWGLAMQDELSTPVAARAFVRMCADWLSRAFAA